MISRWRTPGIAPARVQRKWPSIVTIQRGGSPVPRTIASPDLPTSRRSRNPFLVVVRRQASRTFSRRKEADRPIRLSIWIVASRSEARGRGASAGKAASSSAAISSLFSARSCLITHWWCLPCTCTLARLGGAANVPKPERLDDHPSGPFSENSDASICRWSVISAAVGLADGAMIVCLSA